MNANSHQARTCTVRGVGDGSVCPHDCADRSAMEGEWKACGWDECGEKSDEAGCDRLIDERMH